jgi:type II secretion system protein G
MTQTHKHNSGFTLIELLVVIAIIGLLASAILSSLQDARALARDNVRLSDMHQIQIALEQFHLEHGRYPDRTNDNVSSAGEYIGVGDDIDAALAPYLNPVPSDPLHDGVLYYYSYDSHHYIDLDCSTPTAQNGMVYGFNMAEQLTNLDKITCLGGDMNLDNSVYNNGVVRSSY